LPHSNKESDAQIRPPRLFLILAGYAAFCGLSLLSKVVYPFFGLVVLVGMALPLLWGRRTGKWAAMGFSRKNMGMALLWGLAAGVVSSVAGLLVLEERAVPANLGQQLLIGIPFWLLVISPFQEFFFRGWMQSELEAALGKWQGLLAATACFVAWHYVSPIVDMATLPLASAAGLASTVIAGLAYGYAFHRSKNIVAPWLAHAISGIVFVIVGAMDFVQAL